jgi:carbon storage regulator
MLVLSRKTGERIHLGGAIVITVARIEKGKVRLGIEAPASLPIWREELAPRQLTPDTDEDCEPLTGCATYELSCAGRRPALHLGVD